MSEDVSTKPKHEHTAFMRWKHTATGRAVWTVLDLAITYIFASLAINSGTLWQWGVAILFLTDGVYNLIRLIGNVIHGNRNQGRPA